MFLNLVFKAFDCFGKHAFLCKSVNCEDGKERGAVQHSEAQSA